jgi:hypothetical protein
MQFEPVERPPDQHARTAHPRTSLRHWAAIVVGLALIGVGVALIVHIDRASHAVSVLEGWCRAIQAWLPWLPC